MRRKDSRPAIPAQIRLTEEMMKQAIEMRKRGVIFREISELFGLHYTSLVHAFKSDKWQYLFFNETIKDNVQSV